MRRKVDPLKTRRILARPPPKKPRGGQTDGAPEFLMRMKLGDCFDINRGRFSLESLARQLRHIYDVDRRWTVRAIDRPGWSRIWRVL